MSQDKKELIEKEQRERRAHNRSVVPPFVAKAVDEMLGTEEDIIFLKMRMKWVPSDSDAIKTLPLLHRVKELQFEKLMREVNLDTLKKQDKVN